MILRQFYLNCLTHASYLVGDESTRTAAVVDPQRDSARAVERSAERSTRDRSVIVRCAGGYRSSIAVSLLQRSGRMAVSEIAGGIGAWEQAGLPVAADQD